MTFLCISSYVIIAEIHVIKYNKSHIGKNNIQNDLRLFFGNKAREWGYL